MGDDLFRLALMQEKGWKSSIQRKNGRGTGTFSARERLQNSDVFMSQNAFTMKVYEQDEEVAACAQFTHFDDKCVCTSCSL
jgi:hypothetical protein